MSGPIIRTLSNNSLLMGHVLRLGFAGVSNQHRIAEVRVPRQVYNDVLYMFFEEHQDFWAHDKSDVKVGDWVGAFSSVFRLIHHFCFSIEKGGWKGWHRTASRISLHYAMNDL